MYSEREGEEESSVRAFTGKAEVIVVVCGMRYAVR
jgi:hypothetical protein